uniref:Uncharacterized protein n=1 Tax=Arundo donax TaxID=35708 RepID=A0A0A9BVU8_ARUDO
MLCTFIVLKVCCLVCSASLQG